MRGRAEFAAPRDGTALATPEAMTTSHPLRAVPSPTSPQTIAGLMTASPLTIESDRKLSDAHRMMTAEGLRHLPVLRKGKLVGVLSQRDLFLVESMAGVDPDIDVIADAMTEDVYKTSPDAPVRDVVKTMVAHKYGCAVVLEEGRVIGIFTVVDALRHLADVLA